MGLSDDLIHALNTQVEGSHMVVPGGKFQDGVDELRAKDDLDIPKFLMERQLLLEQHVIRIAAAVDDLQKRLAT